MPVASQIPSDESSPFERVGEASAVRRSLGLDRRSRWRRRIAWALALALAAGVAAFVVVRVAAPTPPARWLTAAVARGELTTSVTATGSLAPVRTVDIAAEISGRIVRVHADENAEVVEGQPLVEIDSERLRSQLAQAKAQAAAARATTREARATLVEVRAELGRIQELVPKGLSSRRDLDGAKAAVARAQARIASGEAQEQLADAQVASVETDLGKALILSPIDGIVLTRTVEPGNAVAAAFQAPVLMTLAADLGAMELDLDIDEADVGVVAAGQKATFTVDAFPDRTFAAEVISVLFASKKVSNVVTYGARLSVDNHQRLLRPGMTATATISTGLERGALLVPNAALRFTPPSDAGTRTMFSGPPGGGPTLSPDALARQNAPRVYLLKDGQPVPREVVRGASDGQNTVVLGGGLAEGDRVILARDTGAAPP